MIREIQPPDPQQVAEFIEMRKAATTDDEFAAVASILKNSPGIAEELSARARENTPREPSYLEIARRVQGLASTFMHKSGVLPRTHFDDSTTDGNFHSLEQSDKTDPRPHASDSGSGKVW